MILNPKKLKEDTTLKSDVCIVGAGAAGIALAKELASEKIKVNLIETGGLSFETESQQLAIGKSEGDVLPAENHYLFSSRLRYVGGSTNHWAGYLRPLDSMDFEKRDWIPHSGWPFGIQTLQPYYEKALTYFGVQSFLYSSKLRRQHSRQNLLNESKLFVTRYFHIAKKLRFLKEYLPFLKRSPHLSLVLNTTAVAIHLKKESQTVEKIEARASFQKNNAGKTFFKAKYFILTAGGIENARLLLLSDQQQKQGLGNQHDRVGRFFMEHPHLPGGRLFINHQSSLLRYYRRHKQKQMKHFVSASLCPSERAMREHRLLNLNIQLVSRFIRLENGRSVDRSRALNRQKGYPLLRAADKKFAYAYLKVRAEQIPNPESRIVLSKQKDPLGFRIAHLKWKLQKQDFLSIQKNLELLAKEIGMYGIGRAQLNVKASEDWPKLTYGGSHHMGTTRMHQNPREGVVDEDLKLHYHPNLFILGSSVFPTGGGVNPTFTILALAVRLGEHIKRRNYLKY